MNALVFAQILGPTFLALSALMLINKYALIDSVQELIDHAELRLTASLLPLILGITIIITAKPVVHYGDYLIYAIGILFTLSGLFRLFFTQTWLNILFRIGNTAYVKIISYLILIFGIMLTYHGHYII